MEVSRDGSGTLGISIQLKNLEDIRSAHNSKVHHQLLYEPSLRRTPNPLRYLKMKIINFSMEITLIRTSNFISTLKMPIRCGALKLFFLLLNFRILKL